MDGPTAKVAMLGGGFIGQVHAQGLLGANLTMREPRTFAALDTLIEKDPKVGAETAERFGFERVVSSPDEADGEFDLFINAGPNLAHHGPSIAMAERGAYVLCEKPTGQTPEEAYDLWQSVEATGARHAAGFSYRFFPALRLARDLIASGELGEIHNFRGRIMMFQPHPPDALTWRFSREMAGDGARADLGSHLVDLARFLVGEVTSLSGLRKTLTVDPAGAIEDVNDDRFSALVEFENGAYGSLEGNRLLGGRGFYTVIEVEGSKASLSFDVQRLNELVLHEDFGNPRQILATREADAFSAFWSLGGAAANPPLGWTQCWSFQAYDALNMATGQQAETLAATLEDGYRTATILGAVERSEESGERVAIEFQESVAAG